MYRTGVDYCVMLPSWNSRDYVIFTKDHLVLLIERDNPNIRITDIPRLAAEGAFKPLLFSENPAMPDDADVNPDDLQVLVIEDEQFGLSSLRDALMSRDPDFPAWWEVPVPLVMHRRRRIYPNPAAARIFGEELKELPRDLPGKDEFLVNLQSGQSSNSLMFHRLEDDIFTLEDCTGDVLAAADIAWWAALGKAWMVMLDKGKRVYRRYEKAEIEEMEEDALAVLSAENTLIPCEWEDGMLGYLCVKKRAVKKNRFETAKTGKTKTETGRAEPRKPAQQAKKRAKTEDRPAEGETTEGEPAEEEAVDERNRILKVLSPQTMGLLAPGSGFFADEAASAEDAISKERDSARDGQQPRSSQREKRRAQKDTRPGAAENRNSGERNA
jgi:hypothetical protein